MSAPIGTPAELRLNQALLLGLLKAGGNPGIVFWRKFEREWSLHDLAAILVAPCFLGIRVCSGVYVPGGERKDCVPFLAFKRARQVLVLL